VFVTDIEEKRRMCPNLTRYKSVRNRCRRCVLILQDVGVFVTDIEEKRRMCPNLIRYKSVCNRCRRCILILQDIRVFTTDVEVMSARPNNNIVVNKYSYLTF
jgi:hypothetical protein